MKPRALRILLVLAAFAVLHADAVARADQPGRLPRVAVAPFAGRASLAKQARKEVVDALAADVVMIPGRRLEDALAAAGSAGDAISRITRAARAIGADAVITGTITQKRRRYTLKLVVYLGSDGEEIANAILPLRRKTMSRADRRGLRVRSKMLMAAFNVRWKAILAEERAVEEYMDRGGNDFEDGDDDDDFGAEPEPVESRPSERTGGQTMDPFGGSGPDEERGGDEAAIRAAESAGPRTANSGGARLDRDTGGGGDLTRRARPRDRGGDAGGDLVGEAPPRRWVRGSIAAGGSFIARELRFAIADGTGPGVLPAEFENKGASGVMAGAAVHPLSGLGTIPGNFGVAFQYDRTVGVKSQFGGEKFDTIQQRWGVGVEMGYTFATPLGGVAVKAAAGYNRLRHEIDSGDVEIGLPDVDYAYVDAGVGVRVPVVSVVSIYAEGRYLAVLSEGELGEEAAYGGSDGSGSDLEGGIAVDVFGGMGVRAGLRRIALDLAFDGTGALTDVDQDGEADVDGATDTYVGGYLTVGYRF